MLSDLKLKAQVVNGNLVSPSIVLQDAGKVGVHKVEARDPEEAGRAAVDPVLEKRQSGQEISDVTAQRFQRRIRLSRPHCWNLEVFA